jgi:hypothetical protein
MPRLDRRHVHRVRSPAVRGFLKVSVEELLIALRDDRHLLNDPEGLLAGNYGEDRSREADTSRATWTLYPDGFSAERFIEVIETEAVWGH